MALHNYEDSMWPKVQFDQTLLTEVIAHKKPQNGPK